MLKKQVFIVLAAAFAFVSGPAHSQEIPQNAPGPTELSGDACSLNLLDPLKLSVPCSGLTYTLAMVHAPHGAYSGVPDPGCIAGTGDALSRAFQATTEVVGAYATGGPVLAAGSFIVLVGKTPEIRNKLGGDIANWVFGRIRDAAYCVPVVAYIPETATIAGVRMEAFDVKGGFHGGKHGWHECPPGSECAINFSRFEPSQAQINNSEHKGRQYVYSTFRNWSHDRERWARIIVIYRLPAGESVAPPV